PHPVPLHVLLYDLDILILFLFYSSSHHRHLHSFPTRRSSDLPPPAYRAQTTVSTPTASVTSWERERPRRTPRRERRENFTGTSSPADDLVTHSSPVTPSRSSAVGSAAVACEAAVSTQAAVTAETGCARSEGAERPAQTDLSAPAEVWSRS